MKWKPQQTTHQAALKALVGQRMLAKRLVGKQPAQAGAPSNKGQAILQSAKQYLGKGGMTCSEFTSKALKGVGVSVPSFSTSQYQAAKKVSPDQAQPGDILYYASPSSPSGRHIEIYAGGGKSIGTSASRTVSYSAAQRSKLKLLGVGRF